MELWHAPLLIFVGTVAGIANVLAGGGSLLSVPTLLFLGLPGPEANGTNRIALLPQNISAAITFFTKGYSDIKLSLTLSAATLPGAIAGALVGTQVGGEVFDRILAIIMVGVLILMATEKKKKKENTAQAKEKPPMTQTQWVWGHIGMIAVGFWGGFIHVGIGFIIMPILHRVMGLDLVTVNMHKVTIAVPFTIIALIIFALKVELFWLMGLALALGNTLGGWIGAHTAIAKGEKWIKITLYTVLTVFIIKLLFF